MCAFVVCMHIERGTSIHVLQVGIKVGSLFKMYINDANSRIKTLNDL